VEVLRQVDEWGAEHAAAAAVAPPGVVARWGDAEHVFRWASITKLLTAYALLVAVEEGTIDLDDEAGPERSTIRHLAAHASGLPFDAGGPPIAQPGRRRIYSNAGYEVLAERVAAAARMPFRAYLRDALLEPLGMRGSLRGSAASGFHGPLSDLAAFAREVLRPTLLADETVREATTVQFPGLAGVLPDVGRMEPNDWGIGFELKDAKSPHWTGTQNSPRTFGHFGGSGTFLWFDPERELALGCLTDREFGQWALEAWPRFSDAVLDAAARP
jgi:CubicO group peptidase (beta-lactamase class C family)